MNQYTNHRETFGNARPATGAEASVNRCTGPEERSGPAPWPGLLAWLAEGVRRYLSLRRTRMALDRLSDEQLKDIGYRRVPGPSPHYERLP